MDAYRTARVHFPPRVKQANRPRRAPNMTEKLAASLCLIRRPGGDWLIPEPVRSKGTAEEICAAVEWDHHWVAYAHDGTTDPRNMMPMRPEDHAEKTALDVKVIAKGKRITEKRERHRAMLAAKAGLGAPPSIKRKGWKR